MIVVPTYDEAPNVTAMLDQLVAVPVLTGDRVDVLVVDDNSPDGTADLVREHPSAGDHVHLLSRPGKGGLGTAYRAGFAEAIERGYDTVIQMDGDGSHPAGAIPAMLRLLEDHDLVVGSRYVAGGRTEQWPARRRALSFAANGYARTVLRLRTRDTTSGFRAWRTSAVTAAGLLETRSSGYGFQVETTWRAEKAGLRVVEHPIVFTDRSAGSSKMDAEVAREAAVLVLRFRLASR